MYNQIGYELPFQIFYTLSFQKPTYQTFFKNPIDYIIIEHNILYYVY